MSVRKLIVEADGGSRGNPGQAGSGTVIIDADTGEVLFEIARFIGVATNNVAEYTALLAAFEVIHEHVPSAEVLVRMDSKLVIEQMSGAWKIKHPDMQQLAAQVQRFVVGKSVRWQWIPREENKRADALANKAMDEAADSFTSHLDSKSEPNEKPMASVAEFNAELPSSVRAPGGVTAGLVTVILVRHGRTLLTESKRISGRGGADPELSALGIEDATKVAAEIAKIGKLGPWGHLQAPTAVIASPILRTRQTAQAIADQLKLPVHIEDGIAEIGFGEWDGLTNEEAASKWPNEWALWQGSWEYSPPGGESLLEFDLRVAQARDRILSGEYGSTVVLVSHVMPIRSFIREAMKAGIEAYWRPQISPCSISILRMWGDQAAEVVTVNSTAHL